MVLTCECGGAVEMTEDNGATEYPETRVEFYECAACNRTGTLTLTGSGERKSGCLTARSVDR